MYMNYFTELLPRKSDYAGVRHGWNGEIDAAGLLACTAHTTGSDIS